MIVEAVRLVGRLEAGEDYRKDGNEKFDTGKHAEIRRELREDAQVKTLIQKYWDVLVNDMDDPSGGIDKATYVSFFLAVSRALLQRAFWSCDETNATQPCWQTGNATRKAKVRPSRNDSCRAPSSITRSSKRSTCGRSRQTRRLCQFSSNCFQNFYRRESKKTKKKARKATVEEEHSLKTTTMTTE